jgi:hypothetical protein
LLLRLGDRDTALLATIQDLWIAAGIRAMGAQALSPAVKASRSKSCRDKRIEKAGFTLKDNREAHHARDTA